MKLDEIFKYKSQLDSALSKFNMLSYIECFVNGEGKLTGRCYDFADFVSILENHFDREEYMTGLILDELIKQEFSVKVSRTIENRFPLTENPKFVPISLEVNGKVRKFEVAFGLAILIK